MTLRVTSWLALAVVAQAIQLRLIWAGPSVRYQHWRVVLGRLEPGDAWSLVALAVYSLLIAWAGRHWISDSIEWLRRHASPARVLALLGALAVLSVSPQKSPYAMSVEVVLASVFALAQAINIALAIGSIRAATRERIGGWLARWLERPTGVGVAVVWVTCVAALLNVLVWERHPHITDEVAYWFQAKYFAAGMLRAPAMPVAEAFSVYLLPCDASGCYSVFPPGWPLLLAVGMWLGLPWLVNPLLGGLNVWLIYLLFRDIYDQPTAKLAALLGAVSPWHIYLAMSFMSHTFVLTCALVAAIGCVHVWRGGRLAWASLSGLALGVMSTARPLDAVALSVVAGGWLLFSGGRPSARGLAASTLAGLCAALSGAAVLPYNAALTGHATEFPVMSYMNSVFGEGANSLGFGANRGGANCLGGD